MLSALTRDQTRRRSMQDAVAPIWDGAEVWLIAACVLLWGAPPGRPGGPPGGAPCAAAGHDRRPDRAQRGVPMSPQRRRLWRARGHRLRRRFAGRRLHARRDARRPRPGVADRGRPLRRGRSRLAHPLPAFSVASGSVSATRCWAPSGWPTKAGARCVGAPNARSLSSRPPSSPSCPPSRSAS